MVGDTDVSSGQWLPESESPPTSCIAWWTWWTWWTWWIVEIETTTKKQWIVMNPEIRTTALLRNDLRWGRSLNASQLRRKKKHNLRNPLGNSLSCFFFGLRGPLPTGRPRYIERTTLGIALRNSPTSCRGIAPVAWVVTPKEGSLPQRGVVSPEEGVVSVSGTIMGS